MKDRARAEARDRLKSITPDQASGWSGAICDALLAWDGLPASRYVMLFAATPTEPDLGPLVDKLGVRVCAPRVDWDSKTMQPCALDSFGELVESRHGVRQPGPSAPVIPASEIGLVLVPGLAFDQSGGRLGRGAGYYDRFLTETDLSGLSLGVAFGVQIVDTVPTEPHDARMRWIVTERGVIDTHLGSS